MNHHEGAAGRATWYQVLYHLGTTKIWYYLVTLQYGHRYHVPYEMLQLYGYNLYTMFHYEMGRPPSLYYHGTS